MSSDVVGVSDVTRDSVTFSLLGIQNQQRAVTREYQSSSGLFPESAYSKSRPASHISTSVAMTIVSLCHAL